MRFLTFVLAVMFLSPAISVAVEVSKVDKDHGIIWLSKFPTPEWKIDESLCIYQEAGLLGCGTISGLSKDKAAVKISDKKSQFFAGDEVTIQKNLRSPATTETVAESLEATSSKYSLDLALGLAAGFNYYYPTADIRFAVTRHWSLGLNPVFASYSNSTSDIKFYGAYLTVTNFYTHYTFKGFNFEGGVGLLNISASTTGVAETKVSPFAMKLTGGWRGRALVGAPVDLGVNLGFQYIFLENAPLDISFKKFLPLLSVFIAYNL